MPGDGMLNVRDFGAVGDGEADDTAAIQKAINKAARAGATVLVPAGAFRVSRLKLRSHTGLLGYPTWSYRDFGGSILRLADAGAPCLLDLTGAVGVTINGLCLDGQRLPGKTHGVMFAKPNYGKQEDAPRIERCRISGFSGDGVHLRRIWCFSVRHCMLSHNGGHGLYVRGWDGFILDNWLSGNAGAGYAAPDENSSITMTANRIEWNQAGGIVVNDGHLYNITGNYIDRSGGPGIRLTGGRHFTIFGNVIYRSGRPDWRDLAEYEDSHVWFEGVVSLTFSGNTMRVARDDGDTGNFSPRYGVVYHRLENSLIKNNTMQDGALEKLFVDLHDNRANVIIADNVGSLFVPPKDKNP